MATPAKEPENGDEERDDLELTILLKRRSRPARIVEEVFQVRLGQVARNTVLGAAATASRPEEAMAETKRSTPGTIDRMSDSAHDAVDKAASMASSYAERFSEKGLLTTSLQDSGRLSRYALGLGGLTLRQQRARPSIINLRRRCSIFELKKKVTREVEMFVCLAVSPDFKEKKT